MDGLRGKVAAITGAALGLGRATAIRMAEEGAAVAILDPLSDAGQALADALSARACVYLDSDEAKFVTGSELVVDGGYTAA